jgi:hypothetical protein
MRVSSHVEQGLDFGQYMTYAWGPADALPTGDARLDKDPFFKDHVEGAVEKALARKGLFLASTPVSDLLIHYHAAISQKIDINQVDRNRGYCIDDACGSGVTQYEAGTVVVDIVDARTNRLVWRGWAQDAIEDALKDQDVLARKIDEAVTRMLQQFPRHL